VIGDAIYVVTQGSHLFRLSAESGTDTWWTSGIERVLSASDRQLYAVDGAGRLVVLSTDTGSRIGSLATQNLDLLVTNKETDRIFIGTSSGVLQCLREANRPWPMVHVSLREAPPEESQAPATPPARQTEPPTASAPRDVDPFGGGTPPPGEAPATNPFDPGTSAAPGSSEPVADPFGGTPAPAPDPFDIRPPN
jgi:hypothetical protein